MRIVLQDVKDRLWSGYLDAKQKHLGCKKRRAQSEVTVI